jgi:phospholipid transport system substrate-binding protein
MIGVFSIILLAAFFLAGPALSQGPANTPTAEMRNSIGAVLDILKNPDLQVDARTNERRGEIMKVVRDRFDFAEMSRLALGRYWKERTEAEKKEFVELFPRILESAYVNKIEKYNGETVEYVSEIRFDGKALVRTMIKTMSGTQVSVDYRVMKEARGWMVYDVIIEGVSLINNYRNQFNDMLSKEPYPEFEKELREKVMGL